MHFRSILSGTLALLLASSLVATAAGNDQTEQSRSGFFHLPSLGLPGVFGNRSADDQKSQQDQVQVAQSDSAAIQDQLRQLNGKVEELNFQILQMQEQIRKTQEDNEFRFQQLEQGSGSNSGSGTSTKGPQKKSDAGDNANRSVAEAPAGNPPAQGDRASGADQSGGQQAAPDASAQSSDGIGDIITESQTGDPGKVGKGAPPKSFGSITVDKNGNVVNAEPPAAGQQSTNDVSGQPLPDITKKQASNGKDGTVVASLPPTKSPDELYRNSYQFIMSGDYSTAEQGFRDHISRFPKDPQTADAHYWLGEALLGQQKYRDAAEVFLSASKDYPKAKKAPDMLLKLGVALVGLNQRDVACATFGEIGKRYPDASAALKDRVKQERTRASC
jgi:tol-pal system protein YbgF